MNKTRAILLSTLGLLALTGSPLRAAGFPNLPPGERLSFTLFCVVIAVCLLIGFLAIIMLYTILWPGAVRRGGGLVRQSPGRALLAGALSLVILFLVCALARHIPNPVRGLLGVALALGCVWAGLVGLCAVAHELGERLQASLGLSGTGAACRAVLYGGLLFGLVGFLPGLGQLIQLVIGVFALGTGVCLLAPQPRPEPPPPAVPTA